MAVDPILKPVRNDHYPQRWLREIARWIDQIEAWRRSDDPFPQYPLEEDVPLQSQGIYQQVADNIPETGLPLDAASNYQPGDYYTLIETGTFNTAHPELNGLHGATHDRIYSDGSQWLLATSTADFLSKIAPDTAAGKITFGAGADSNVAASAGNDLMRKAEVDAADAAHAGLTVPATDVHGARSYTDTSVSQHAALQADPDDVHGAKSYTDAHAALLADPDDAHGAKTYADGAVGAHEALQTDPDDVHGSKTYADAADAAHAALTAEDDNVHDIKTHTERMLRWGGRYATNPGPYEKHTQILDGPWLMVANTDTSDRPGPQPSGDPIWISDAPGPPLPFSINSAAETVWMSGNRFNFQVPVEYAGYRWYCPDASGSLTFEVWGASAFEGANINLGQLVAPTSPGSVGWYEIPTSGLLLPGTLLDLVVVGRSVTQPNTFTANWQVENKNGNPDAEKAWFQNNATQIRVHHTSDGGDDQQGNLEAVPAGASLLFAGQEWTVTSTAHQGSHVRFNLSPNQGRPGEDIRNLTFQWGSTDPIQYAVVTDHYLGYAPPSGSTVKGFQGNTYPPAALNDNLYGVDINADLMIASPDWDFAAYSG